MPSIDTSTAETSCDPSVAESGKPAARFDYGAVPKEKISCPVCGESNFEILCETDRYLMGLSTARCQDCGLIMTNPAPTEQALEEFYAGSYRNYYRKLERPDLSYIRRYALDRRAEITSQFLAGRGVLQEGSRVLDVGCGEGSILKAIGDTAPGMERMGVEPYRPFAEFAAAYASCPVLADLKEVNRDGSGQDLILLSHVLEHILQPVEFLRELGNHLAPDGKLFVDVPDVCGYHWLADLHIAHVYHFSPHTLARTAHAAGLKVEFLEVHHAPKLPRCLRAVLCHNGEDVNLEFDRADEDEAAMRIRRMSRGARAFSLGFHAVMAGYEALWNWTGGTGKE